VRIYIEPNLIKTTVGALAAGSVPDQDRG